MSDLMDNLLYEHMKLYEMREKDIYMRGSIVKYIMLMELFHFYVIQLFGLMMKEIIKPKEVNPTNVVGVVGNNNY